MEPSDFDQRLMSLEPTQYLQNDPSINSMIEILEDLPVKDKASSLVFSDSSDKRQDKENENETSEPVTLSEEALLSSPEFKLKKQVAQELGIKRQQSFGLTLNRDIRQEQLTQLIAAKIREGQLMVELNSKNAWEKESESLSWTIHTKAKGMLYWIRNEIKINNSYDVVKNLLIEFRKKKQINTDVNDHKSIEQISNICSINYERTSAIEPTDYLILRLERQAKEGCFKIAEMSIEDKRCPVIPGIKRGHLELRYWQLAPDENNDKCSKLWIIQTIKIKSKGSEAEIKLAHEKNKYLIQKILNEI